MRKQSIPYVIKRGADQFECIEALRVRPAPKLCGQVGYRLRCFSNAGRRMVFTDIDTATHVLENRIEHPLTVHRVWFQANGYALGYTKSMRVGNPTEWFFFDPKGGLVNRLTLPDAASDVAQIPGTWYIGCRDGTLYAFDLIGKQIWSKRLARLSHEGLSGRAWDSGASPSPIVAADASRVVLSHEDQFWLLDQFGNKHWELRLPHRRESWQTIVVPNEVPTFDSLSQRLAIQGTANGGAASVGFIRRALRDLRASTAEPRVRKEVEIFGNHRSLEEDLKKGPWARVRLEAGGGASSESITRVAVSEGIITVGTTDGALYLFDHEATLLKMFMVGNGPVSMVLMDRQELKATHCAGILLIRL